MNAELDRIRAMIESDTFTKSMGIRLIALEKGYSKMTMTVRNDQMNFHKIAHGAAIFSLADAAFAAAGNSHGEPALALCMNINYRSPAKEGTRLVAEAFEESLGRKTGLYKIAVKTEEGKLVASAQGTVYRRTRE